MTASPPAVKSEGWVYHTAAVTDAAFSPDGTYLTTVSGDASM
eukprot:SAG31_NODE_13969_length_834_cov_0.926531_1_plen_41_part_10